MPLGNRIVLGLAILALAAAGWWWLARESGGDSSAASRPPVAGPAMAAPRGPDTVGEPAATEEEQESPPPSRKDWLGDNGDLPFALRAKYGDVKFNRLATLMATVLSGWNVPREDAEILSGPEGDVRVWLPPRVLPGGMTKSDYLEKLNDILGERADEFSAATGTFIRLRTGNFGEHGRLLLVRSLSVEQSLHARFEFVEYLTQDPGWKSGEERRESLSNHTPGDETRASAASPILFGRSVSGNRIPEDFAPYFEYLDGGITGRAPR